MERIIFSVRFIVDFDLFYQKKKKKRTILDRDHEIYKLLFR